MEYPRSARFHGSCRLVKQQKRSYLSIIDFDVILDLLCINEHHLNTLTTGTRILLPKTDDLNLKLSQGLERLQFRDEVKGCHDKSIDLREQMNCY